MTLRAVFKNWAERYFSDEEAVILLIVLILGFAAIVFLGRMLALFLRRWSSPFCYKAW